MEIKTGENPQKYETRKEVMRISGSGGFTFGAGFLTPPVWALETSSPRTSFVDERMNTQKSRVRGVPSFPHGQIKFVVMVTTWGGDRR